MIHITEKESKKVPGGTSLFVTFDYSPQIVEIVKQCSTANYDKKTFTWEVPCVDLSFLVNSLSTLDDIEVEILNIKDKHKDNEVKLSKFKTTPFDYQADGIKYGLNHDRFLLLDAPGLGKTLQLIYIAEQLRDNENLKHCLILCGVNTLKTNWKKEIERHSKLSCMILGQRIQKKSGKYVVGSVKDRLEDLKHPIKEFFIITNIETIRDSDIVKEINNGINNIDMIVLDECHVCKNPQSTRGKNLLKLTNATHRIGATGTVIVNNPLDAYVPLKWIGVENCTYTNFKYFYCNYGGQFGNQLIGFKNINVLKNMLEECSIRRTKDLLNLPPKNIIHEYVDMNDNQQLFYDNLVDGIADQVDKVSIDTSSIFSMVARLRQATACPSALTSENISSSKIERACELVDEIIQNGEKVVVFSVFKETLNVLQDKLEQYHPLLCTGDIKDNIVSENIDKFQTSDYNKVMLCTTSKMGVGITLTAASNAIFIDSTWTQASNLQCEDRIYRIGSEKPVFIYYLWAANTIDEHVKEIVEDKSLVGDYVVDNVIPPQLSERLKAIILDLKND